MELLNKIQQELQVPKGHLNSFSNYYYRNCEDILEAVKPLLGNTGTLTLSDEIVQLGERFYVMATATLKETRGKLNEGEVKYVSEEVRVTAYAREALDKKGMDDAQITGAASSYARKYALCGLFCIDDGKDADADDNTTKAVSKQVVKKAPGPAWKAPTLAEKKATIKKLIDGKVLEPLAQTAAAYENFIFDNFGFTLVPDNYDEIIRKLQ